MKRREHLTPDITPLIDVVFLLIIFFLVSSNFKKDELALSLILPKSGEAKELIKKQDISIELSRDEVALKGKKVSMNDLDKEFAGISDKEKPVNIRIDKNVEYFKIMKLFDLLKKYGLNNLALESQIE